MAKKNKETKEEMLEKFLKENEIKFEVSGQIYHVNPDIMKSAQIILQSLGCQVQTSYKVK